MLALASVGSKKHTLLLFDNSNLCNDMFSVDVVDNEVRHIAIGVLREFVVNIPRTIQARPWQHWQVGNVPNHDAEHVITEVAARLQLLWIG
jgi:hypothetical protein